MRLSAVAVELGLEERAQEERVPWKFGDPYLPAVVKPAEPQPAVGQRLQVVKVQAVAAVVALGAPTGSRDLRGERARHDHDRLLVTHERALERDDQLLGGVRYCLSVLDVHQAADVSGVLDKCVLKAAAGAEERNPPLAGGPDR